MIKSKKSGDSLTVYLSGEIDHHAALRLREEMEALLGDARIKTLCLDFEQVVFMDSSGVGLLIGRYKTMQARGGRVCARNLRAPVAKLFYMAGLHRIIEYAEGQEAQ